VLAANTHGLFRTIIMPWSSKITRAFATIQGGDNIHENQYYGPYNKLLYTIFPADTDFAVSPNYLPPNDDDGGADFTMSFELTFRQRPVLILEVKPPQHLLFHLKRETADTHIRCHLIDLSGAWCCYRSRPRDLTTNFLLSGLAALPVLYGISAIGTRLCFYEFEKGPRRMTPQRIPSDHQSVVDVAPREQWNCDILESDGEQRLRALATQITEACERLQA